MATTTMGIKLDSESRLRLKRLAEARNRFAHWLVKQAIQRFLDTEERYEQERAEDQARYQRYAETDEYFSNDEMMSWLDELAAKAADKGRG